MDKKQFKNWKGNLIAIIIGIALIPILIILLFWFLDIQFINRHISIISTMFNHQREIISCSFAIYILAVYGILKFWTIKKPKKTDTLASQRWSTIEEQKNFFGKCPIDINETLEVGGAPINYINDNELLYETEPVHDLCVGATRSGKSRKIVRQLVIICAMAGESMIFNDPKKEMFFDFNDFLISKNYDTYCLDFRKPEYSNCINPLDTIVECLSDDNDIKIDDADQWAQDMVTSLVVDNGAGERIWIDGQKALLKSIILAASQANMNIRKKNLYSVYQTLALLGGEKQFGSKENAKMILSAYMESLDETNIARTAFSAISNSPEKTRGSFITSALNTINLFSSIKLGKMLSRSDFKFRDFAEGKKALFVVAPDEKNTYDRIASIIFDQSYQSLVYEANNRPGRKLKKRVHMIYDEFGNMPRIDNMQKKMTVALSRGIIYHLYVQDFAQIDDVYDEKVAKIIRGNCNLWYFISSADLGTCKEIAEAVGEETIWTESTSGNFNDNATTTGGGVSFQQTKRQLVDANELMTSDNRDGNGIIVKRTYFKPSKVYLPDCSKYKWYKNITTNETETLREDNSLDYAVPRFFVLTKQEQQIIIDKGKEGYNSFIKSRQTINAMNTMNKGILPPQNDLYWYWSGRDDINSSVKQNVLNYISKSNRILNRKEINEYLNSKEFLNYLNQIDNTSTTEKMLLAEDKSIAETKKINENVSTKTEDIQMLIDNLVDENYKKANNLGKIFKGKANG